MTDLLHERLAALRTDDDEPDWDDVVRRSARSRTNRVAVQAALLVLGAGLLAAPALGLDRLLGGRSGEPGATLPMWLGLRADGTFCIALAGRCDDVDRSRRLVAIVVASDPQLLRGYANAPRRASLQLVTAEGARSPVPMHWVEAPGGVHVFAERVAFSGPAQLVLRAPDGRVLAVRDVADPASRSSDS